MLVDTDDNDDDDTNDNEYGNNTTHCCSDDRPQVITITITIILKDRECIAQVMVARETYRVMPSPRIDDYLNTPLGLHW